MQRLALFLFLFVGILGPLSCLKDRASLQDLNDSRQDKFFLEAHIEIKDLPKIDPKAVQAENVVIGEERLGPNKYLYVSSGFGDHDFVTAKVCAMASGECREYKSHRVNFFIVDLPEGQYQVTAAYCYWSGKTISGQEACSPWKRDPYLYTQIRVGDHDLQAGMKLLEELSSSLMIAEGFSFFSLMDNFVKQASQCSDKNEKTIAQLQAQSVLGPYQLAAELEDGYGPEASQGLGLVGGEGGGAKTGTWGEYLGSWASGLRSVVRSNLSDETRQTIRAFTPQFILDAYHAGEESADAAAAKKIVVAPKSTSSQPDISAKRSDFSFSSFVPNFRQLGLPESRYHMSSPLLPYMASAGNHTPNIDLSRSHFLFEVFGPRNSFLSGILSPNVLQVRLQDIKGSTFFRVLDDGRMQIARQLYAPVASGASGNAVRGREVMPTLSRRGIIKSTDFNKLPGLNALSSLLQARGVQELSFDAKSLQGGIQLLELKLPQKFGPSFIAEQLFWQMQASKLPVSIFEIPARDSRSLSHFVPHLTEKQAAAFPNLRPVLPPSSEPKGLSSAGKVEQTKVAPTQSDEDLEKLIKQFPWPPGHSDLQWRSMFKYGGMAVIGVGALSALIFAAKGELGLASTCMAGELDQLEKDLQALHARVKQLKTARVNVSLALFHMLGGSEYWERRNAFLKQYLQD